MVKFNTKDYEKWRTFRVSKRNTLTSGELELVCKLHSTYFKHSYYIPCTCSPKIIKQWITELNNIYGNTKNSQVGKGINNVS